MRHILFIYNPRAGRRFHEELLKEIEQAFSKDHIQITDIHDLAAVKDIDKYDTLVAIGGDGTVNTVAEYCSRYNSTLAIIPRGSGDGLARHLRLRKSTSECIERIKTNSSIEIDTVYLNHHFFVNVAGTGFEAEVAHTFNHNTKRGLVGYVRSITSLYNRVPEQNLELRIDGKLYKLKFFSLSFANGSQWGNDFEIASNAILEDGIIEIVAMQKPKWFQFPAMINQLREKKQIDSSLLKYYSGKVIEVESPPIKWHKDGEAIEIDRDINISVQPLSLRVNVDHE